MVRVLVLLERERVEECRGRDPAVAHEQLLLLLGEVEVRRPDVGGIDRERADAGRVRHEALVPGRLRGVEDVEREAEVPGRDLGDDARGAEAVAAGEREAERRRVGKRPLTLGSTSQSQTGKFESVPPSTIRHVRPCVSTSSTGSKKYGIDMLIRAARAIGKSSGSIGRPVPGSR